VRKAVLLHLILAITVFFRCIMAAVKENEAEDIEAGKSAAVVVGKKPVHPIIWNLMLIVG